MAAQQKVTLTVDGREFPCGECSIVHLVYTPDALLIEIRRTSAEEYSQETSEEVAPVATGVDLDVRVPSVQGIVKAPVTVYPLVAEHLELLHQECPYFRLDRTFPEKALINPLSNKPKVKVVSTSKFDGGDAGNVSAAIAELGLMLKDFYENPEVGRLLSKSPPVFVKDPDGTFHVEFPLCYFGVTSSSPSVNSV
jgi:hypothetical protein